MMKSDFPLYTKKIITDIYEGMKKQKIDQLKMQWGLS